MSRSCINLVGNTTQGENIGTGINVYKGKSTSNTLQFKSLSVTGTAMSITCDDNNIYLSAQTGSGGSDISGFTDSSCNISIGCDALASVTTGGRNIAIGRNALSGVTSARNNIAIGPETLSVNLGGEYNIGLGLYALCKNTSGNCNMGIGYFAMQNNTTGGLNVVYGIEGLKNNTDGCNNVGLGNGTLYCNETGCYNIGIGQSAGFGNKTNSHNLMVGYFAGVSSTGSSNTYIGSQAGRTANGSHNVFLGASAGYSETNSCKLHIANCNTCSLVIGCFSNNTICNGGNNTAWDTSSDCRIKECVTSISAATLTISQLNPVTFDYITGYSEMRGWDECRRICDYGFLAQEFETVFPQYVKCTDGYISSGTTVNDFRTVNSGHLIPVLVKAIQELEARIAILESK